MPNWVVNTLKVVKGDPREIFEFVRSEGSVMDFNKLIPMPESIRKSDQEVIRPSGFKVPGWYAWSVDNWGTKWNASTPNTPPKIRNTPFGLIPHGIQRYQFSKRLRSVSRNMKSWFIRMRT